MSIPSPAPSPIDILIVEDSPTQALRLQGILEKRRFRVTAARNGRLALGILAKLTPSVIISDIQMPEMDGYELCQAIKADPLLASISLILLTSLSAPQDIIRGLECGADNFVVKPYEEDFLLSRLDTVIANRDLGAADDPHGIPVHFAGRRYVITSDRRQILNLLLSTYETAVRTNEALLAAQEALKAAQDQLIEAEKAQSVGRLAAGVAHEVKNPLAIIEMGVDLLAEKPDEETVGIVLGQLKESVTRANQVITGLMELSSPTGQGMQVVPIDSLVEKVLAAREKDLARMKIEVAKSCAKGLPGCRVDVAKIEQVFSNVIANALQEMPDGGKLTLRTFEKVLGPADVSFEAGDRSGVRFREGDKAVVVEVGDTGPGIPAENLQKIFEPFFSTKPTGKGMGLGLTVARKLMELHGGRITLANQGPRGAIATLIFKPA